MDPNANYWEIRNLVDRSHKHGPLTESETNRLVDLFNALDEWLTKGGFLPKRWTR